VPSCLRVLKTKKIMEVYIVAGYRSAVGKAPRGVFRFTRPDDLASDVIKHMMSTLPNLDKERIGIKFC
jgi:acetyl-CoA acyltransferase